MMGAGEFVDERERRFFREPIPPDPEPGFGFKESWVPGVICVVCGSVVPMEREYRDQHMTWHDRVEAGLRFPV